MRIRVGKEEFGKSRKGKGNDARKVVRKGKGKGGREKLEGRESFPIHRLRNDHQRGVELEKRSLESREEKEKKRREKLGRRE